MCVLTDGAIAAIGQIVIDPFIPEQVNPASYDLRIGGDIIDLATGTHTHHMYGDVLYLYHGKAILATTVERVKLPADIAAWVSLKSTLARSGLDHALAGWIDPGFVGQITLELSAHREVALKVGQRICQIVFHQCTQPSIMPYQGKYQNQIGVTPAR